MGTKAAKVAGLKNFQQRRIVMTTKKETTTKSSKPAYIAYHVRNNKDEQGEAFWTRIGVAFSHQDGKGYNLLIETIPLDGRITLRVPSEKTEQPE
jgi:hypothetical protein